MFARKLGRLAGLVFVLGVVFGGVIAVTANNGDESSTAAARSANSSPVQTTYLGIDWD